MNRRSFLKLGMGSAACAVLPRMAKGGERPAFTRTAEEIGPILVNSEIRRKAGLSGRKASFFIDDTIWIFRDLARQRPKSLFDNRLLGALRDCHDRFGLKMQFNIFYRTDFYYGLDEFTLKEMPDAYRDEWAANADWLRLGFHSLQEFPDYPFVNGDYKDVKDLYLMICGEVERFAGAKTWTSATVPHWTPMSKDGCRALRDCGVRLMESTFGPRYRYTGDRDALPYGHAMRLEQNRKPEAAWFWRDSRDESISASLCSYNHVSEAQELKTAGTFNHVYDPDTGLAFRHLFGEAPCLNLCTPEQLKGDTEKLLGKEHLVFSDHEQYFYKDYLAYQADYMDKIRLMCRMMADNGYAFMLLEDLV